MYNPYYDPYDENYMEDRDLGMTREEEDDILQHTGTCQICGFYTTDLICPFDSGDVL